jgi:hypothetical protein
MTGVVVFLGFGVFFTVLLIWDMLGFNEEAKRRCRK